MNPQEKREAEIIRTAVQVSHHFSGPLPPPEILAKYDQILPGAADRIIKMAESQHDHRQNLEKMAVGSNVSVQKWGLAGGFVIAMTTVSGGIYLSAHGVSGIGLAAIIAPLAALVGVFVYGKSEQKKELREKAGALTEAAQDQPGSER